MLKFRNLKRYLPLVFGGLLLTVACERELKPVDVEITDPRRHYYPVIQGELLGITYEVENLSKDPLFIKEVQTTCGCYINQDKLPIVIPPNQKGKIHFTYNSTKNTGHVENFAWLYGNFSDSTWRELQFDTNVVPPVNYTPDYEELWHEVETRSPSMKDLVDGKSTEKGYYTDEGIDPRELNREETEQTIDNIIGF